MNRRFDDKPLHAIRRKCWDDAPPVSFILRRSNTAFPCRKDRLCGICRNRRHDMDGRIAVWMRGNPCKRITTGGNAPSGIKLLEDKRRKSRRRIYLLQQSSAFAIVEPRKRIPSSKSHLKFVSVIVICDRDAVFCTNICCMIENIYEKLPIIHNLRRSFEPCNIDALRAALVAKAYSFFKLRFG